MTRTEAAEQVKAAALRIGFDASGVATAVPLFTPIMRYKEWIEKGYQGMMGYMDRNVDAREDVSVLLPNAKSVVVVALNYYHDVQHPEDAQGKVSRYAWGTDYHVVMPPMLDELCEAISNIVPGSTTKRYTDTGPVLEKEWAVRAGIAWQGKHSNVLRRDIGSWFFLGVVITDADLSADTPMPDYCGSCTACIDVCPTSAIVEPYVVDATKCLSYWTIEVKPQHEIPLPIAEHMDGWVFGCDACQDVCPWNRFQQQTQEKRFAPRFEATVLSPSAIVNLSTEEFAERFRDSPITRPKLAGLQRNARALVKGAPHKEHE